MINNLRWIGVLGAVYVACAAVGTAQAAGPDDRAESRGPGAIATASAPGSDWFEREAGKATTVIRADDRSGLRGSGKVVLVVPPVSSLESTDDGFAWDDAALSVLATLGVFAILGAGAVSIRHRNSVKLS